MYSVQGEQWERRIHNSFRRAHLTETRLMNEEVLQEKRTNRSRSSMARKHMGRDSAGVATGDGLKKTKFEPRTAVGTRMK